MRKLEQEKVNLHERNAHRERYNFDLLIGANQNLAQYVAMNEYGDRSIDFSNPKAVKELNKTLLAHYYQIVHWDLPDSKLCPPIPGRADYLHYVADLLAESNQDNIPMGSDIIGLDIGVGANCIYPLLGNAIYGWQFVGSDIDSKSLSIAEVILTQNNLFNKSIFLCHQQDARNIFKGVILPHERFDFVICNPPFHASAQEAKEASLRKQRNLTGKNVQTPVLNFGGSHHEIWCEGGEKAFILKMVNESVDYAENCLWFTSLVSKETTLSSIHRRLEQMRAKAIEIIDMSQGNKKSRMIAWSFLNEEERTKWFKKA